MITVGELTRWCQSGSVAPHSHALSPHILETMTLHSYVTAEIICNTAHVYHKVLPWSRGPCAVCLYELHHESPGYCCIRAALELHHSYVIWDYVFVT